MAQNTQIVNSTYAEQMNQLMKRALTEWWNNLTKEQLLAYIADQPDITVDHLRKILSDQDFVMSFGVSFAAAGCNAEADFHNA